MIGRACATMVVCALVGSEPAAATPISRAALHELCRAYVQDPASDKAKACETYVLGYLDGLRSDAELEPRPADSRSERESWSERAARTRLGRSSLGGARTRDRSYCLPDSVAASEIIGQLVGFLDMHPHRRNSPAAEALAATMRRHYACKS